MNLFRKLFSALIGASLLIHGRLCGAITIVGGSGFQKGVELNETGINCESFEVRYYPEVDEDLAGITGEAVITAVSSTFAREVTIVGETKGGTGVMAFTLATACTVANDIATFGATTGTLLLREVTETQNRTGWRSVNIRLASKPGVVA